MGKTMARLKREVPFTIFEQLAIKRREEFLFENAKDIILSRYKELVKEINMTPATELSYDNIISMFKPYFYEEVLNDAIELMFTKQPPYNVIANVLEILTEKKT